MWLSLISMASSRPKRWLKPPPQRTAYFSSARRPGVVLRVQQMRVCVPATRRTNSCVAVATPERWPRRLSAARSAASTARAGPVTVISAVLAATLAPSRACAAISISGASRRNAAAASGSPAITPALRATTMARAGVSSGMVAVEVTSPARPRSSASVRVTASSISSGERKASGQRREVIARPRMISKRVDPRHLVSIFGIQMSDDARNLATRNAGNLLNHNARMSCKSVGRWSVRCELRHVSGSSGRVAGQRANNHAVEILTVAIGLDDHGRTHLSIVAWHRHDNQVAALHLHHFWTSGSASIASMNSFHRLGRRPSA